MIGIVTTPHAHELCAEEHPPDGRANDHWAQPHCLECGQPMPLRAYVAGPDGRCGTCGALEGNHDLRWDLDGNPLTCLA